MKEILRTLAIAATACAAAAQPIPKLKAISQEYFQRGSTIEVTITGENLANTKFLVAGEPGMQFKLPAPTEPVIGVESSGGGITAVSKGDPNKLVATLDVNGTAALGAREIRLASPDGVSNPLTLNITHFPEFIGASAATSLAKAQELALRGFGDGAHDHRLIVSGIVT